MTLADMARIPMFDPALNLEEADRRLREVSI